MCSELEASRSRSCSGKQEARGLGPTHDTIEAASCRLWYVLERGTTLQSVCMHDMNHRAPNDRDVMQVIRGTALIAILTTGVAALAAAQSSSLPASPPPQGVAAANRAAAAQLGGLELTADQKARVEAITAKYAGASRAAPRWHRLSAPYRRRPVASRQV